MSAEAEDYDPFEDFDRMQRLGGEEDPYPGWAKQRRQTPVWVGPVDEWIPGGGAMMGGAETLAVALSFDAVSEVLRDGDTFTSSGYAKTIGLVMGHTILEMDEPEHFRYRGLIQMAFQRKQMEEWAERIVRPVVETCLEPLRGQGRADLVRELTFPFPVKVICGMIGIPEEAHARFHRLAVELISIAFDPARGIAASQGLGELFAEVLAERRKKPANDLMSLLANAELEGTRLEDEEIFAFLRLLAPAGAETTSRSSANLLCGLLSSPDQWEALCVDRNLFPQAIEEGLRWETPLTGIQRTASRDAEVCGVPIVSGTAVQVCMGSANRDETRWEDPGQFDIFRPRHHHASFAFGPHTCLGMHLARLETRVALESLMEMLPGLRLDPDRAAPQIGGRMFRSPAELPVRFDA